MSTHWTIRTKEAVTLTEVQDALRGYLNGEANIENVDAVLYVKFRTDASNPTRYLNDPLYCVRPDKGRWFEVEVHEDEVEVTTRLQDEFVMNVASGFARFVKRYWRGKWK